MPKKPTHANATPATVSNKPGRPRGAKNRETVVAAAEASRCPKCGSTNRTPYSDKLEKPIAGVDRQGRPYTHVIWRRTSCADCGQFRKDRMLEHRPQHS